MDRSKKIGIILIVVAGILIISLAIYLILFNKSQKDDNNQNGANGTTTSELQRLMDETKKNEPKTDYRYDPTQEANRDLNSEDLRKMALSFAERLGSYSNQGNYGNISDLKIFMTAKMRTWADNYLAELKAKNTDNTEYYGITTLAISGTVKKFDDKAGVAEIVVTTQRRESKAGSISDNVFNQDITINYLKQGQEWKVDGAFWQK